MTRVKFAWITVLMLLGVSAVHAETVLASVDDGKPTRYDGGNFHGRVATGERFNNAVLAVAHRTLPLHSCIEISYRGRRHTAEVNDRGPCLSDYCQRTAPERIKRRSLDMTPALARLLRFPGLGQVNYHPTPCRSEVKS